MRNLRDLGEGGACRSNPRGYEEPMVEHFNNSAKAS
jgi:hypothetical protein